MNKNPVRVGVAAEKFSATNTAAFFEERVANADRKTFMRVLNRKGREPPRAGDEA